MNCVFQTTFTYIISFDPHNQWEQNGTKVIIRVGNPATMTRVGTGIRTKSSEVCMLFFPLCHVAFQQQHFLTIFIRCLLLHNNYFHFKTLPVYYSLQENCRP